MSHQLMYHNVDAAVDDGSLDVHSRDVLALRHRVARPGAAGECDPAGIGIIMYSRVVQHLQANKND